MKNKNYLTIIWEKGGAYGFLNTIIAGTQFLTIFIFASALSPQEFGNVSIYMTIYILFCILIGLGLSGAIQQGYYKLTNDEFEELVSSIVKFTIAFFIIVLFIIIFFPATILNILKIERYSLLLALIAALCQVIVQLTLIILQTHERVLVYLKIAIFQIFATNLAVIIFYYFSLRNWESAITSLAIAPIMTVIIAFRKLNKLKYISKKFNKKILIKTLKYSLPLVPHQIAGWGVVMLDRFIIISYFDARQAGIYSLSFQISQAVNIASNSINQAIVPALYRQLSLRARNIKKIKSINITYVTSMIVFSILYLLLFSIIVPIVIKPEYENVIIYGPWHILSLFFLSCSRVGSNIMLFNGDTIKLSLATIFSTILSIFLNLILIPLYGVIAACWTSVLTCFVLLLLNSWSARSAIK